MWRERRHKPFRAPRASRMGADGRRTAPEPCLNGRVATSGPRDTICVDMHRRALFGVIAASAALLAASAVAAAQGTLTASPSIVERGATVTFNGGTCSAGTSAILLSKLFPGHAYGVGAVSVRVRANGRFTARFAVPTSVADGNYSVTARCGGANLGVVAHVRVQGGTFV